MGVSVDDATFGEVEGKAGLGGVGIGDCVFVWRVEEDKLTRYFRTY